MGNTKVRPEIDRRQTRPSPAQRSGGYRVTDGQTRTQAVNDVAVYIDQTTKARDGVQTAWLLGKPMLLVMGGWVRLLAAVIRKQTRASDETSLHPVQNPGSLAPIDRELLARSLLQFPKTPNDQGIGVGRGAESQDLTGPRD